MPAKDLRRRELATIHCLKRDLNLDDTTYRELLWTVARVKSASDLDPHQRQQVIDHMRSRQQKQPLGGRQQRYPGRHSKVDRDEQLGKIEALLTDMGLPWSYADSIAQRVAGVAKVAWIRNPDRKRAVIAALTYEQEKRQLLAAVDGGLAELGMTRAEIQERANLKDGWERHPVALKTARNLLQEIWLARRTDRDQTHGEAEA